MVILKISAGATLAFFMEVSEFMVLSKTSSLTLSIAGIFKVSSKRSLTISKEVRKSFCLLAGHFPISFSSRI